MKKNNKSLKFNLNDFFPILEGLDISINFSIVIFLSSFFLESLDTRFSSLVLCGLISLSFISRVCDLKFSKIFNGTKLANYNVFIILFFIYLVPVCLYDILSEAITIGLFVLSRLFLGIFFALSYRNLIVNNESSFINIAGLKFWILLSFGISIGSFFYLLINEIYSNDFLNQGGWKILYFLTLLFIFFIYFWSKIILKKNVTFNFDINTSNSYTLKNLKNSFIMLIPIMSFLLFTLSNWFPKFSHPENLYFLSYNYLNFFITILILIFIYPLANLVGIKKSLMFLNVSIFIISFVLIFPNHSSSYSIDFLKFFISVASSFAVCSFVLQLKYKKRNSELSISDLNLGLVLAAITFPLIIYYSINFVINYSAIYIFLSIVYFINYIFLFKKDG